MIGLSNIAYNADIDEIKAFINAYPYVSTDVSFRKCKEYLTEPTDEEYLNNRADCIASSLDTDDVLKTALGKASTKCSGEECSDCPINKYCNHYINLRRSLVNSDSLKMIDLFCGAGGLSLGFTQEGFITALANDIEPCCIDTYSHNHPETKRDRIILGDIKQLVDNVEEYTKGQKISVIVGGPPCQGFSMANRQRIIDDPRNKLYRNYVEIVNKVQPPFFVMENVKGMLSVANQVIEDFEAIGYKTSAKVLNARDFGVPQNRERLVYVGNRIGVDNNHIFDEIEEYSRTIKGYVLGDALFGLPPLSASRTKNNTEVSDDGSGKKISSYIGETNDYISLINQGRTIKVLCNHKARYNNDRDIEIFSRLNPGDNSNDPKIADIMPYARRYDIFKDKYYKLDSSKISKTITAHMKFDCNMYIHPDQARGLTPREAARIQSYPDDYFFRGAYTKTYMQIGNSVPPLLGRAIATVLRKYIKE